VVLVIGGADCRSQVARVLSDVAPVDGRAPEVALRVVGQAGAAVPGGAVERALFVQCPKPGGPDTVTVRWTPPTGAAGVAFPGVQPVNPLGPPPYEFLAVPVSDATDAGAAPSLSVAYAAPAPPQPAAGPAFVDCFTAVTAAGSEYSATFVDDVTGAAPLASAAAAASAAASAAGEYRWWQAEVTLAPAGAFPLDQTLCQEWAGFLQDPSFFVAVRFPESASPGDGRSAPLPLVVPEPGYPVPRVALLAPDMLPSEVFEAALELRPERLGAATAILPPAPGERWMTLGVAGTPPASCPEGLAGAWEVRASLALDLGGTDDSCRECVLEQYYCYDGEQPPFFFGSAAPAPAGVTAASVVRAAGVTCVGPLPLRLAGDAPEPPITIERAGLARTGANALVKIAHSLRAWLAPDETVDVTFATHSATGMPWALYRDAALTDKIEGPVTISGPAQFDFWASTRTPFGFRGPESLTVTATAADPAGSAWTTDHLWAGAWAAPPPAAALAVAAPAAFAGDAVTVSGTLPDGTYRLVVVPNGAWVPGDCYTGEPVAALDVTVSDGTLPPTQVWPAATVGSYDVLALAGACDAPVAALAAGDARVAAAADSSLAAGVVVGERPVPLRRHLRRIP